MTLTPDEALAELLKIRTLLDSLPEDDPARDPIVARREELREAAAVAADLSRSPDYLRHDLGKLEARLVELDSEPIAPKLSDNPRRAKYLLNNPFVYASKINEEIEGSNEAERQGIIERIEELKRRIAQLEDPDSPTS